MLLIYAIVKVNCIVYCYLRFDAVLISITVNTYNRNTIEKPLNYLFTDCFIMFFHKLGKETLILKREYRYKQNIGELDAKNTQNTIESDSRNYLTNPGCLVYCIICLLRLILSCNSRLRFNFLGRHPPLHYSYQTCAIDVPNRFDHCRHEQH